MSVPEPHSSQSSEIAHVLFMDIVAYSTLPTGQQQRFLEELNGAVRNTPAFSRASKESQLIRLPTGDGMALVFFRDPEAPVRCALQISEALRELLEIKLRMGIHTGPVYRVADINANLNVTGGGINVAQRVMDCGDPGHILVSKATADVLNEVGGWKESLKDLGQLKVKHGQRLHLFELLKEEAGRRARPTKLRQVRMRQLRRALTAALVVIVVAGAVSAWLFHPRKAHALSETDTVVVADFANTTGDAIFDDTLKQALATDLQQSPFFNTLSERKVNETLKLMGRNADQRLDERTALDLCQRTRSKAVLAGSIANLGSEYVLGLNALNCQTGDSLARTDAQASKKEDVLNALGKAATQLREKVGESLRTIQKYGMPIEQVTTPSLEALQAYSLGRRAAGRGDPVAAVSLFQRAIVIDPKFAMAYALLGASYSDFGETTLASENTRKAFELRGSVSEWERFYIESSYHLNVSGDLVKGRETDELWARAYPRSDDPRRGLFLVYTELGQHDKALLESREALRLDSASGMNYANLVISYLSLDHLDEARTTAQEAEVKELDSPDLRWFLYQLAFSMKDAQGMAEQAAWFEGKPEMLGWARALEGAAAAYFGKVDKARESWRQGMAAVVHRQQDEAGAAATTEAALQEALFGNVIVARQRAAEALRLSKGRDVEYGAALALAFAGDFAEAQTLADNLATRFPESSVVWDEYLPTLRAHLALSAKDTSKALEVLRVASPYEMGRPAAGIPLVSLYPAYVRGQAYFLEHQYSLAAAEFQKIIDHPSLVLYEPIGALSHVWLARAYAMQGDTAKARAAYQEFFTLWKDADADIPVLKEAKAEFAKLQ